MNPSRLALCIIGVSTLLAAEPICRRIVFPAIHKHHSAATIARWTEWNKTHTPPTPKAILAELDLICPEILTQNVEQTGFIPYLDEPLITNNEVYPTLEAADARAYEVLSVPTTTGVGFYSTPPTTPSQVPESGSLALMGIGLFTYAIFSRTNKIKSN